MWHVSSWVKNVCIYLYIRIQSHIDIVCIYRCMYFHSSIYTKFKKKNISPSFEPLNLSTFPPGPQPPYAFHFFDQNPVVKHFVTSVFTGNKSWSGEARSNHQCLIVIRKLFIKYTPKKLKHVPLKKGHPFKKKEGSYSKHYFFREHLTLRLN